MTKETEAVKRLVVLQRQIFAGLLIDATDTCSVIGNMRPPFELQTPDGDTTYLYPINSDITRGDEVAQILLSVVKLATEDPTVRLLIAGTLLATVANDAYPRYINNGDYGDERLALALWATSVGIDGIDGPAKGRMATTEEGLPDADGYYVPEEEDGSEPEVTYEESYAPLDEDAQEQEVFDSLDMEAFEDAVEHAGAPEGAEFVDIDGDTKPEPNLEDPDQPVTEEPPTDPAATVTASHHAPSQEMWSAPPPVFDPYAGSKSGPGGPVPKWIGGKP